MLKNGEIKEGDKINFVVPTGNFGNILAAFYAMQMGLPVNRLICASNDNNVLTDFINTGVYDKNREFKRTISPSMDILISSNLERLQKNWHIEGNVAQKSEKEHWSRKPELSRNGNIGTENLDKTVKNVDIEGNEILQLKKKTADFVNYKENIEKSEKELADFLNVILASQGSRSAGKGRSETNNVAQVIKKSFERCLQKLMRKLKAEILM